MLIIFVLCSNNRGTKFCARSCRASESFRRTRRLCVAVGVQAETTEAAISPQSARLDPRCGVPKKTTHRVELRIVG